MGAVGILMKFFGLAFSALLPLINPLGSALVFLGLVGGVPESVVRKLSRQIALRTIIFLAIIQALGTTLLAFFGISLPVVQVAGGLVLAAMGWGLLNEPDAAKPVMEKSNEAALAPVDESQFSAKVFYPFTFPITAGPGAVVVMLTLTAHASVRGLIPDVLSHLGIFLAVVVLSVLVYLCYAYTAAITARIRPQTAHGILRIIAFVLLCIGVQITWNGTQSLLKTLIR